MNPPISLSNDDVYALPAYVLYLTDILPADAVLDRQSILAVQMPNRNGFIIDDRPDTKAVRCMTNCK